MGVWGFIIIKGVRMPKLVEIEASNEKNSRKRKVHINPDWVSVVRGMQSTDITKINNKELVVDGISYFIDSGEWERVMEHFSIK